MIKYEILEIIKKSNKSSVFLVLDNELNCIVVKKELKGKIEIYDKLKTLNQKYLPKIYDVYYENDITYVYEEYIEGESILNIKTSTKQIDKWFIQLCDVLKFLHKNNIIHRDIKPSNILVGADSNIRLIDFDAARKPNKTTQNDTKLLGTHGFAPPEQYGFAQTDFRSDIYSLGVTLKYLLGENANKKIYKDIINKCTEFEPKKRYKNINALKNAWLCKTLTACKPILITLMVGVIIVFYINNKSIITQLRYPNEELLLYAITDDYIIANADELQKNLIETKIEIDLNNDKNNETIKIYNDYNNIAHVDLISSKHGVGIDLLNFMQFDFPFNYYLHNEDTYVGKIKLDENFSVQATFLDLDNDKNKEIIITVGNNDGILVSAVYKYNDSFDQTKDMVEFKGFMWGTNTMKIEYDGTIIVEVYGSPYAITHYYFYNDNVKSGLVTTDFEKHKAFLNGEIPAEEVAKYVAQYGYNNYKK